MLEWAILGESTGQIKQFHVRQVSTTPSEVFKTNASHFTFSGLSAGQSYTFEVAAENVEGGLGSFAKASVTTGKLIQ